MNFLNSFSTLSSSPARSTGFPARGFSAARLLLVAAAFLSLSAVGCGNTLYLVQVNRAEKNFQEAKELGAEEYAPYEYYSAKVRLAEAKRQAAAAEYGNASDLSDEATDYATKAIMITKKSRRAGSSQGPSTSPAPPEASPADPAGADASASGDASSGSAGGNLEFQGGSQ